VNGGWLRLIGASGRPLNFTSKDFPVVSRVGWVLVRSTADISVEQEGQTASL
jgi:hypothetical protein